MHGQAREAFPGPDAKDLDALNLLGLNMPSSPEITTDTHTHSHTDCQIMSLNKFPEVTICMRFWGPFHQSARTEGAQGVIIRMA